MEFHLSNFGSYPVDGVFPNKCGQTSRLRMMGLTPSFPTKLRFENQKRRKISKRASYFPPIFDSFVTTVDLTPSFPTNSGKLPD